MVLCGIGYFLGNRQFQGKEKTYNFARFQDESGQPIEVSVDVPLNVPIFSKHKVFVDVIQGKYDRFNLVKCDSSNDVK